MLAQTENQRRALDPVAARFTTRPVSDLPEPGQERADDLGRRAVALANELILGARSTSLELPVVPLVLYRGMIRAARALATCEVMLDALGPRSVVIGSTHGVPQRALALTARRAGVASMYVPHAPLIANMKLADLPVDFAALRGAAEVERYRAAGAVAAGMSPIGNPGADTTAVLPAIRPDGPAAFALPTDDDWALERLVEVVHEALGDQVIASPHPRADRERLQDMLPSGWQLWEQPTFELLRQGPPALIQFSSGTGLESLQLGIPTIDLKFPGEPPNYPYLDDPRIPRVSDAAALRLAVDQARAISVEGRRTLQALAREWVSAGSDEAAAAGALILDRVATEGPRSKAVWDAWGQAAAPFRPAHRVRPEAGCAQWGS
ncbi:MAG: hypothetical protein M3383_04390 [Actinomycetota bacterium]|nr:hypothetical protein [Actinomycetota bacterium]